MTITERNLGVVSYPPNHQACYVRVSLASRERGGLALSIKARFTGIDRRNLFQGAVVEVARTDIHDARRYMITRTFKDVMEHRIVQNIHVEDVDHFKNRPQWHGGSDGRPAPVDRVRFYLSYFYFNDERMRAVLEGTLNFTPSESNKASGGITITCTTDQFARFLIDRNLAGVRNGFMDLKAKLIDHKPRNFHSLDVSDR